MEAPRLLVIGRNGEGKSNLLEAVELLGSLRSHRCSADRDLIRRGERQSLLAADCSGGDRLELELRRQEVARRVATASCWIVSSI